MQVEFASVSLRHGMELEGGSSNSTTGQVCACLPSHVNMCKPYSSKEKYATNWRGQI